MNLILFNVIGGSPPILEAFRRDEWNWSDYLRRNGGAYDQIEWCKRAGIKPRLIYHNSVGFGDGIGYMDIDAWQQADTELKRGQVVAKRELAQHCDLIEYVGTWHRNPRFDKLARHPSSFGALMERLWKSIEHIDRIGCGIALDHSRSDWSTNHLRAIASWWMDQGRECFIESAPTDPHGGYDERLGAFSTEHTYQTRLGQGHTFHHRGETVRFDYYAESRDSMIGIARRVLADGHTICLRANKLFQFGIEAQELA